jgi:hypothetical protein
LRVTSIDPQITFAENCHTLLVNPRGCGIRSLRPLKPGMRVRIEGLPGCGTATATVASNLAPVRGSKFWIVGIGLDSRGNDWCIAPTPPDWVQYLSTPPLFSSSALPAN